MASKESAKRELLAKLRRGERVEFRARAPVPMRAVDSDKEPPADPGKDPDPQEGQGDVG